MDEHNTKRRKFLKDTILTSVGSAIGINIVFANNLPYGMSPIGLNSEAIFNNLPGKSDLLTILNDRPINAETPAHLLNDMLTPNDLFFVRNNGIPPHNPDKKKWVLTLSGESCLKKTAFTIQDLKSKFKQYSYNITVECGGNGRKEFNPPAKGNQWSTGAVGCAKWTGVRLKDVLNAVGVKKDAVYVGYYGGDTHLSGEADKQVISRGVPIKKAMEDESLIAWAMNDQDLPLLNGFPLRLVFGGYPASCSGKWLTDVVVRNVVHDGPKMGGQSYRMPCEPVAPGTEVKDEDMCIIEEMPVKSLITFPKTGAIIKINQKLPIKGKAWTSATRISRVEYSIDFGMNWQSTILSPAANRFDWQEFSAEISFPKEGYYEVWAKATDDLNATQPVILPGWNPRGYLNNACHRIAVKIEA